MWLLALPWWIPPALAEFRCAGFQSPETPDRVAAKPARITATTTGTRQALVLFARFKGDPANPLPAWAGDLFDPDLPGSIAHFYDTMSFGRFHLRGQVGPRVYESAQEAGTYLSADPTQPGRFGEFALEILGQADRDLDFTQFDNDGPDGIPNSGDDDGLVDAVFIVLERVPAGFLLSGATGIASLGFEGPFTTADPGVGEQETKVLPGQGTLQQGRSFAEAAGAICHEYGHVLGLPDLYNTEFFRKPGTRPEEDSAGVGAWCLMGWGTSGWNGNDGPNSFCAWSRMKLGWAEVIEVAQTPQDLRMGPVGQRSQLLKVPLTGQEYFLAEYRRRTGNYYDRNIPGEGLLIWHVSTRRLDGALASQAVVDLECADGRWWDAGYPLGKLADVLKGGDNLDFWAHDAEYARAHAGNLGDATDPFDGVRFRDFGPETNPASHSADQRRSVRLEGIRLEEGMALARVQAAPLLVTVDRLRPQPMIAGEEYPVEFRLTNRGGVLAADLKARLSTQDTLVEILQAEALFRDLEVDRSSTSGPLGGIYPRLRFRGDFAGTHRAALSLEIYAGAELVEQVPLTLLAVSLRQRFSEVSLIDTAGNRDGKAQPGEFIRLGLKVEAEDPGLLSRINFSLRPLDERVRIADSPEVFFSAALGRKVRSPEFLLPADLEPGTRLSFEFTSRSQTQVWKDTLFIEVGEGQDQTPPRVVWPRVAVRGGVVDISLAEGRILEGGRLRSVSAQLYRNEDTTLVATIPLTLKEGRYAGAWSGAGSGYYLVEVVAVDQAGNMGRSPFKLALSLAGEIGQPVPEYPLAVLGKGLAYEVLYSPDGRLLAVGSSGGIWLHETSSFREVGFVGAGALEMFASPVMAFSPDSRMLASGSSDGAVRLWDLGTQQELDRMEGHTRGVTGLRFSPDGRFLYSSGGDNAVRIWDLAERAEVGVLEGGRMGIGTIELSPNGRVLATGISSVVRLWDLARRQASSNLQGRGAVRSLAFSPDGEMLAVAEGFNVRLWGVRQGLELGVLENPYGVNSLSFSPDGQTLVLGGTGGAQMWAVKEQKLLGTIGGNEVVRAVSFSPDGQTLALSQDTAVRIWDLQEQQARILLSGYERRFVADLAFSPDGRTLAAGEWGGIVRLWEVAGQREQAVLQGGGPALSFSPDGRFLASGTDEGQVRLHDLQGQAQDELIEGDGRVQALAFSPDGKLLAAAGFPGVLRLWDLGKQQYHWYFSHQAAGTALAFSPDGRFLATGGVGRSSVWEIATQQEVGSARLTAANGNALAFSPDGQLLALADGSGSVHLLESPRMQEVGSLAGKGQEVYTLAFSPDGGLLAGGMAGGGVMVWELEQRKALRVLKGHTAVVNSVAFSPDGQLLASGSMDGTVRLWGPSAITAVEEAAASAPSTFSLSPAHPNPFNPATTLRSSLSQAGEVELAIYNLMGQRVAILIHGPQEAGTHVLQWNGRDDQGRELASGVYFCRLQAGAQVQTRKLLLLR